MLVIFVAAVVSGVTVFIVQSLSETVAEEKDSQCFYAAQAGIHQAIYDYRFRDLSANGYFSLGLSNIDATNYFVLGATAADLLMVNTAGSYLFPASGGSRYRYLYGLTMQNATNSKSLIIDRMVVTWNSGGRLRVIRCAGADKWSGNLASPADCNITNVTLNTTPSVYSMDYLQFNTNMTGATIAVQFIMTDGSSKTMTVFPAVPSYAFTVKATGKRIDAPGYRTLRADYNAATGKITSYNEIDTEITP